MVFIQSVSRAAVNKMALCAIKDLSLSSTNVLVVGLIIAKGESKQVTSKYGKPKSALTFTVRDSKRHFINCNVWGTEQFIRSYDAAFKIGDIIAVNGAKIAEKNNPNRYMPQTTSPFQLTVNEGHNYIYRESVENHTHLAALISESVKSTSLALHLSDVCGESIQRETDYKLIDLLVAVRSVTERTICTKNGDKTIRDVQLMDESMESIKMTLWAKDECARADKWQPLQSILQLVDVRCYYSAFDRAMVLQMVGATIIMENPLQSSRAAALRNYISKIPTEVQAKLLDARSDREAKTIDLDAIKDVMTVQKIKELVSNSSVDFTAVLYAVITALEIDPTTRRRPVIRHCLHCNQYMAKDKEYCSEEKCLRKLVAGKNYVEKFDICMNLSDHTGTLNYCHMYDKYAAKFLNYELDDYLHLPEQLFEEIHWLHMLERRAIKVLVKRKSADQSPNVQVLELNAIDLCNDAQKLKTF